MSERICAECDRLIIGRRSDAKYCCTSCSAKAQDHRRRQDPGFTERRRRVQQAWLERSGRKSSNRDPNKVCPQCGARGVGYEFTYCSQLCSRVALGRVGERESCTECGRPSRSTQSKVCSDECRRSKAAKQAAAQRSPLSAAFVAGNWSDVVALMLERTSRSGDCCVWGGAAKRGSNGGGRYGYVHCNGRRLLAHRLMAQAARGGADLGPMPVHHTCGNSLCVNPEHLQVVTPQENTAEMLERNAYLSRIADLEDALAKVAPNHALLRDRDRQLRIIA